MERLTSNKKISDMSMIELAHNSCYADNKRNARYRDYDLDIDSRQLIRNLMKDMCGEDLSDLTDEEFDEYMGSMLSIELDSEIGLLALFYRNLWAMANLRETLKNYEDLEEQGRLLKLPCKVGDTVYCIFNRYTKCTPSNEEFDEYNCQGCEYECDSKKENYVQGMIAYSLDWIVTNLKKFGKTVFLTKSEVEAKLKELRGEEDE
jgi:hypothetical protein